MLAFDTTPQPVKLRVEDYLLLDDAGAFEDYAKTELLDGEIVFVNAQHRPHVRLKMDLYDALRAALKVSAPGLRPLVEAAISVPPHNVPEPDIVITSEPDGDGLVPLASVVLAIEVADTTLSGDLGRKAAIYAANGIPEYWVADVRGRVIHQLWSPSDEGYVERRKVTFGDPLTAATLPGLEIATGGL